MEKAILTNEKNKIIYNQEGKFDRLKILNNIFDDRKEKSISKTIKDSVKEHIGKYTYIRESGQRIYLGKDFPNEFVFSKYSQNISKETKLAKGRMVSGLLELIENATNREYTNEKKPKHIKDAKFGFYKYEIKFSFEQNQKERIYSGTLLIRKSLGI